MRRQLLLAPPTPRLPVRKASTLQMRLTFVIFHFDSQLSFQFIVDHQHHCVFPPRRAAVLLCIGAGDTAPGASGAWLSSLHPAFLAPPAAQIRQNLVNLTRFLMF